MPNFRGSTGYGKKFLNAGNAEWGRKMQDDLTWGVKYLVAQGIADPKRIGILGGSYGGYAVSRRSGLHARLVRRGGGYCRPVKPDHAAGVNSAVLGSGPQDLVRAHGRSRHAGRQKWLEERSPLNSADKIKTPLMVAQGANDPRVNRREAEQIVIALRDRGFPVEYLLAPDEGHGFARPVNNIAMFMAWRSFLRSIWVEAIRKAARRK